MKRFLIYEKKSDTSREYAVVKAVINEEEIQKLQEYKATKQEIISVYGHYKTCVQIASNFLVEKADKINLILSDIKGKKEAVVILAKEGGESTIRMVVLYMKVKGMLKDRPFPVNHPGLILLKSITDLSKITICCGSKKCSEQWFNCNTEKGEKPHPYCPDVFSGSRMEIVEKKTDTSNMFLPLPFDQKAIIGCPMKYFSKDLSNVVYFLKEPHMETVTRKDLILETTKNIREMLLKYINPSSQEYYYYSSYYYNSMTYLELTEKAWAILSRCKKACKIKKDELSRLLDGFNSGKDLLKREYLEIQNAKPVKAKEALKESFVFSEKKTIFFTFSFGKTLKECFDDLTRSIDKLYNGRTEYNWHVLKESLSELVTSRKNAPKEKKKKSPSDEFAEYFSEFRVQLQNEIGVDIRNYEKKKQDLVESFIELLQKFMIEFEVITTQSFRDFEIICDREVDGALLGIRTIRQLKDIEMRFKSECQIINIFRINSQAKCYAIFTEEKSVEGKKICEYSYSRKAEEITKLMELPVSNIILAYHYDTSTLAGMDNEKSLLYFGQMDELGKWTQQPYSPFASIKEQPSAVVCLSFYPDDPYRLFLLTSEGTMYQFYIRAKRLEKIEHKVNKEEGIEITRLGPSCKEDLIYNEVQVCDKAKMIFMRSKSVIDCYNTNWTIIHTFPLKTTKRLNGYKIYSNQIDNMLLLFYEDDNECFSFKGSIGSKEMKIRTEDFSVVAGNPILDSIYCSLNKFKPKDEKKPCLCLCFQDYTINSGIEDEYENKYLKYANDLGLSMHFNKIILKKANEMHFNPAEGLQINFPRENFLWQIKTRLPIQITTIEEANMIPLRNGINQKEFFNNLITESRNLTEAIVNYANFGIYETMLNELDKPLVVIGIVGKQSSGKSYFLNQMFSTIFDVSGTRCTDGIWLSMAKLGEKVVVVFDCEGLFSIRRVEMEEIKLCTTLAAVCDILILNQDLSFARQLAALFNKFNKSVGRIGGAKLFKGTLLNLIRDVPNEGCKDSLSEWESTFRSLFEKKEHTFVERLFSGVTSCQPVHYYENPSFGPEVKKNRQAVSTLVPRWKSGKEFLDSFKIVLSHIYTDDDSNIDSHRFMIDANRQMDSLKKNWIRCEQLKDQTQEVPVVIEGKSFIFSINMFKLDLCEDPKSSSVNSLFPFLESFQENLEKLKLVESINKEKDLTAYRLCFIKFFNETLEVRKKALLSKLNEFLPNDALFEKDKQNVLERAKVEFDHCGEPYKICTEKCKDCLIICWLFLNHEGNCNCTTDHKCHKKCEGCTDEQCGKEGGHAGFHFCDKKPHVCGENCKVGGCPRTCQFPLKHDPKIAHKCSENHPCQVKCNIGKCKGTCKFDLIEEHKEHICKNAVNGCPFQCLRCAKNCASNDHYHNERKETEEVKYSDSMVKLHLCEEAHPCTTLCDMDGICHLDYFPEEKEWNNGITKFTYQFLKPIKKQETCKILIPIGKYNHEGKHNCKNVHTCKERCPECQSFCKGEVVHSGKHYANLHRNKENSFFVSQAKDSKIAIAGKDGRIYAVGECSTPEDCRTSCTRRGRAHIHLKACPGGSNCAGVLFPASAKHSAARYYPFEDKEMDLWLCEGFWDSYNWETPYFNDEAEKATIPLCNFQCSDETHSEKSYCTKNAWHTASHNYRDHNFPCKHETSSGKIDVVFCCDTTGSMGAYIAEAKKTINKIKADIMSATYTSMQFAFIGYKDHCDPVVVEYRDLTESTEALFAFISSVNATGGGDTPEAVADGLYQASAMSWRPDSIKFLIHILDCPPHGSEFGCSDDTSPSGCGYSGQPPCKYRDYKEWLNKLKALKVKYIVVKCSTMVNTMIDIFREILTDLAAVDITSAVQIPLEITKLMCKTLENKELTFAKI